MDVYRSLDEVAPARMAGGSLVIGNFDGVHLGHQRLLARAREIARPAVALTFHPLPLAVLSPRQAPPVMTPPELKIRFLAEAGADAVVMLPTTRELLSLDPEQFVREIVVQRLAPQAVVEGSNFGFGRGRAGDIETLRQLGSRYGFAVQVVEGVSRLLTGHHEPLLISSTLIRRLVGGGSVEAAAECLGRPYRLVGRPIKGHGRGRKIGFPTVNLDTDEQLLPAEGIYAGMAHWQEKGPEPRQRSRAAAVNIGPAPTFDQFQPAVEAHLVDFAGRLEIEQMELDAIRRLRGVERFDSVEALVAQIGRDVAEVRRLLPN